MNDNDKMINAFIDEIRALGVSVEMFDDTDEEIYTFTLTDIPYWAVLEVDKSFGYINLYCTFSYCDISNDSISDFTKSEILEEVRTFYLEKRYKRMFEKTMYKIDVWDDGCYMCPGYNARVGFLHANCSPELVKVFVDATLAFFKQDRHSSILTDAKNELEVFLKENSHLCDLMTISLRSDYCFNSLQSKDVQMYVGENDVLFKKAGHIVSIGKYWYDALLELVNNVELFYDIEYELLNNSIRAKTHAFVVEIKGKSKEEAINYENFSFIYRINKLRPFLSDEHIEQLVSLLVSPEKSAELIRHYTLPHIYTEGHTDWRHIKNAFAKITTSNLLQKLEIVEYDLGNKMGDEELLTMCRSYSKDGNISPKIMIFDRDNPSILKNIEEEKLGFKDWGNRVYSFAIPVPNHRVDAARISIEHFYSNEELLKEHMVNGVLRRLYIGYEFDSIGRAPALSKMCRMTNKCGKNSLAIIDREVYDSNNSTDINYALSKMEFAEIMQQRPISLMAQEAFKLLLKKIEAVLAYDRKQHVDSFKEV